MSPSLNLHAAARRLSGLALALVAMTSRGNGPVPPDLAALLGPQPTWSSSVATEVAFGHKDNLLLSATGAERSELVRFGAEVFLWRLPRGGSDFSAFVNAQQSRYLQSDTIDDESEAFAQLEWRYRPIEALKFSLATQGYHLNEVFDVSDTDVRRLVAELEVQGVTLGPALRWSFLPAWWIETQAVAKREKYDDGENDSRFDEGVIRAGWTGKRVEADVALIQGRRRYDRRVQYSLGGRPVEGTSLRVREREAEGRVRVAWDADERWTTTTRLGELQYRDNGSGFFDYRERKLAHEFEWTGRSWTVGFEGTARRVDFAVQTVGFGISPPARIKDDFELRLRVERRLTLRWAAFFEYEWERSRSNDWVASYRVNEGLLGVRWSWDK